MGVGAGLSMYVVVVQKFTFAISSPDEFLISKQWRTNHKEYGKRRARFQVLKKTSVYLGGRGKFSV